MSLEGDMKRNNCFVDIMLFGKLMDYLVTYTHKIWHLEMKDKYISLICNVKIVTLPLNKIHNHIWMYMLE